MRLRSVRLDPTERHGQRAEVRSRDPAGLALFLAGCAPASSRGTAKADRARLEAREAKERVAALEEKLKAAGINTGYRSKAPATTKEAGTATTTTVPHWSYGGATGPDKWAHSKRTTQPVTRGR